MTLSKIKKFGSTYESDEIVARAKDVNPIVDKVIIGTKAKTWFVTGVVNSTTDADGVGSAIFSDVDA